MANIIKTTNHPEHTQIMEVRMSPVFKKATNAPWNQPSLWEEAEEHFDSASDCLAYMKALIIYDDITSAANTTAILHRAAHHADATVKWEITPWRLNGLQSPATAKRALRDAVDAHLIVLAVRSTPELPVWLMEWLGKWVGVRRISDAALAIVGDGTAWTAAAPATYELSRFARRHGLSFIFNSHGGIGDMALTEQKTKESRSRVFPVANFFGTFSTRESSKTPDVNN